MLKKIRFITISLVFFLLIGTFSLWTAFREKDAFSLSERRQLSAFPPLTLQTVGNGTFMQQFDLFATDQFPLRDTFRRIKALSAKYLFMRKDNNALYEVGGFVSKLDPTLDPDSVDRAAGRFSDIYEKYLKHADTNAYLAVIPDKNAFLAKENGYPALDYDALYTRIYEKTPFLSPIEIRETVSLSDFYQTDSHLRQEAMIPMANTLLSAMGRPSGTSHETVKTPYPFYGVYYGQSALPLKPDSLSYVTSPAIEEMTAFDHQNGKEIPVYDETLAKGKHAYEMFLSGPLSLITLENQKANTDKELIVFRDSFGSAIAPLLAEGYAKVTLIDIRYLSSALLDRYVDFSGKDVLFLYSTSVLNHSETIK